ncbi:helix-turn-helix transcriptional regulator [Ottowia sp. VDI28]|uniref:helix-turn-helix transcriptional regulator n=1 Tax=Ottowia sp. VDI28 TaxID=3133968 RepID=UPI003C30B20D
MQFISASRPTRIRSWTNARALESMAGLIGCIGHPNFAGDALAQVNRLLPVAWWSVFQLYPDAPPCMPLTASFEFPDGTMDSWQAYRKSLYLRDQTFLEARERASGAEQVLVHWNAREIPRAHRERIYSKHALRERLSLVCEDEGAWLAVNLYRREEQPFFSDTDIDTLSGACALILSSVQRHLALNPGSAPTAAALSMLTPRERQVCERMLKGWTHEGISSDLQLSPATVKTYRDRAFEKLGIHHRNELFALLSGHFEKR